MNRSHETPDHASRWLLLLAASLTAVLIPLCFTGPAVVLPAIAHELGGSSVALNWIVNGYVLAYGAVMMAAGSLADVYGRKRVWLVGLALFCVTSLTIPLAGSVAAIDGLRLLQGASGSAAFAAAMAALAQEFDGHIRTRVFSLLGTTFGVGLAFGPLLAGWLTDGPGWRWGFLVPAVCALASVPVVVRFCRETRDPQARGLDWPGALSFTAALSLFTYGLLLAPEQGWASFAVLATLALSGVLLALFVAVERRVERRLLDLSLFSQWRFVGVQLLGASPAFAYVVLIGLLPGRFIGIEGQGALQAGWTMLALSAPLLVRPFFAALLATLIASQLKPLGLDTAERLMSANQLAIGNLAAVVEQLPKLAPEQLRRDYVAVFSRVLELLAGVTLAVAGLVFLRPGRERGPVLVAEV